MVILFDTSPTPNQRAMSKRVPHPCRVFGYRACPEIVDRVGNLTLAARPAFYLHTHTPSQLRIQCSTTPPGPCKPQPNSATEIFMSTIAMRPMQPAKQVSVAPGRRFDHIFFSCMAGLILATVFLGFARTYYLAG